MIENKEKIYEIILTIAVFFFLLFNISILRTYFVYAVYVGDLIYLLLFFLEFIVSFLLSYKFYKTIQSKLSSRIKDILLTVFVTIVFYAYLLVFWIFILAMFSKIAPYIQNILGAILILILVMLIPFLSLLMIGICPIFFDLSFLKIFQLIFPPTYYLKGIYENSYFLYMICFSGLLFLGLLGIWKIKHCV